MMPMLFRFSLYGFLKNQRYFEPFLLLAFLEKGLSFFQIGLLITCREITAILCEIPSGAVADVCGRRGSMIVSFIAYIASFTVFGFADGILPLALGMVLFGIGDSFRTGTHKAMIFAWLRRQGRTHERTEVYGYTRSWSKIGSAVSTVLATLFVMTSDSYLPIFFLSILPCVLNIVNFLGYPAELETEAHSNHSFQTVIRHLREAVVGAVKQRGQRRLLLETMGFEGVFAALKDYLQPVLQTMALGLAAGLAIGLSDVRRVALFVGPVYLILFLLSAVASRQSHRFAKRAGDSAAAARRLWGLSLLVFCVFSLTAYLDLSPLLVLIFVLLYVGQNLWRPILVARFDEVSTESQGATILSIESLARRMGTMVLAPFFGLAVDLIIAREWGGAFWPLGVTGAIISLCFYLSANRARQWLSCDEAMVSTK